MVLVAVALATGTVFERYRGAEWAGDHFYGSWWFAVLMAVVAIGAIVSVFQGKLWHQPATLLIHLAVPVILLGGALTTWVGQHGSMVLQPGVACSEFEEYSLPFSVTLDHFDVIPYAGTHTPMDFASYVIVDGESHIISMNNILRHRGYRFYQEDYGDDGSSTLSVAHDPWGIAVTYFGYVLFVFGLLGLLVSKTGPFRRLMKGAAVAAVLLVTVHANAAPRTLPKTTADKMGRMYVLYKGRVCPLQTYAKDFTTKLTGKATYKGLSAEQVLAGYLYYFDEWANEPLVKIKGNDVRRQMNLSDKYACYNDFLNIEDCFQPMVLANGKQGKNLRAASEKYSLIQSLLSGKGLKIFPVADSTGALGWYAQNSMLPSGVDDDTYLFVRKQQSYCQELVVKGDYKELERVFEKTRVFQERQAGEVLPSNFRLKAEHLYNALTTGRWLAMVSITAGLLFFAFALWHRTRQKSLSRWVTILLTSYIILLTSYILLLISLRWIVGGHAPMAGGFDSMNLMALVIGIMALVLGRHYPMSLPAGMLTMGFCLLVAMMSGSNPPVTNLMPVLNSPLLTLHVAVIMCSYALFFFVMMGGVAGLISNGEECRRLNLKLLYPAVTLLSIGIVIGAVWANISWGNYWSWDPKEVWALITLIVYAIPLQSTLSLHHNPRAFNLYCVFAFLSVIITYFGVNFILGGIHAYN